jgi:hypothetical protein
MVLLVSTSVDRRLMKSSKVQFEEVIAFAQYSLYKTALKLLLICSVFIGLTLTIFQ